MPFPHPNTYAHARLDHKALLLIANSDVAWSYPRTVEYAQIKGIPTQNIMQLSLGPNISLVDTLPANPNSAEYNLRVKNWVIEVANGINSIPFCSGIILGPGVPVRVHMFSQNDNDYYYAPLLPFLQYSRPLKTEFELYPTSYLTFTESSGNCVPYIQYGVAGQVREVCTPLLSKATNTSSYSGGWAVGNSAYYLANPSNNIGNTYYLHTMGGSSETHYYLNNLYTTEFSGSHNNGLPIGRVGFVGGYRPLNVNETDETCLNPTYAYEAVKARTSQPAPILVGLETQSGSIATESYGAFVNEARSWGFDVDYYYRGTVPTATMEGFAPYAGRAFDNASLLDGTVVDYEYYMHVGLAVNTDAPQTDSNQFNALKPVAGGGAWMAGQSNQSDWNLTAITRGASWGINDISHRGPGDRDHEIVYTYLLLTGMSCMEALFYGFQAGSCPRHVIGDPLAAPFGYRRASQLPNYRAKVSSFSLMNAQRFAQPPRKKKKNE